MPMRSGRGTGAGIEPASRSPLPSFPGSRKRAGGIPDQVRNDVWGKALVRFRAVEAALDAAEGAEDALFDRMLGRFNRALARLLRTPAPDIAALAAKLDLLLAHEVWELDFAQPCVAALRRDATRLAGAAR